MSRAFVRELDGDELPDDQPERPISEHDNYVTESGIAKLQAELHEARARAQELTDSGESSAQAELARVQRDIRYLENRVATAIVVDASRHSRDSIGFGATVAFEDESGTGYRFRIVGEDEADPEHGSISWVSPLARAANGAGVGDAVTWPRPSGDLALEVISIDYE